MSDMAAKKLTGPGIGKVHQDFPTKVEPMEVEDPKVVDTSKAMDEGDQSAVKPGEDVIIPLGLDALDKVLKDKVKGGEEGTEFPVIILALPCSRKEHVQTVGIGVFYLQGTKLYNCKMTEFPQGGLCVDRGRFRQVDYLEGCDVPWDASARNHWMVSLNKA